MPPPPPLSMCIIQSFANEWVWSGHFNEYLHDADTAGPWTTVSRKSSRNRASGDWVGNYDEQFMCQPDRATRGRSNVIPHAPRKWSVNWQSCKDVILVLGAGDGDSFGPGQCLVICVELLCVSQSEGLGVLAAWSLLPVFCRLASEALWGKTINKALVRSYPSPSSPRESTSFRTWNQRGFQQQRLIKWAWETGNKLSGLLNQILLLLYSLQ